MNMNINDRTPTVRPGVQASQKSHPRPRKHDPRASPLDFERGGEEAEQGAASTRLKLRGGSIARQMSCKYYFPPQISRVQVKKDGYERSKDLHSFGIQG